ncbi:MAG: DUF1643 domain-containing protein [Mobiluncus sp.]|uniref:DUF1643 domain-containing protein n=1 Tax=Mobiluncus sp. TaxID=47293 RepID=UPI002585EA96|nr:DUF1643 domain-containing protein [Mobiluncus sp.]MCI6585128.1 DUF1643 domain-containing protein [Mobiluncus sp.]
MGDNEWVSALDKALRTEDPVNDSAIDDGKKLIGHSVFARVKTDSAARIEVEPASLDPLKPNQLRLLLTHRLPHKEHGEHVVVIGMNPSKARAFSGRKEKRTPPGHMPETDSTATIVRGWLESAALANTKRLTIVNLLPIIETDSSKVQALVDNWTGPCLKCLFHTILTSVLSANENSIKDIRIICAWGNPEEKLWVQDGQDWFFEFVKPLLNAGESLEGRLWRLKYGQGGRVPDFPPHPNLNPSLKTGKNCLIPMPLEHK